MACRSIGGGIIDDTTRPRRGLDLHARATPAHVATRVRVEQARLFWLAARFVSALAIAVGAALVVAQWPVVTTGPLLIWAATLVLGSLIWFLLGEYFRHAPATDTTAHTWHWLALGIALAQGIIWGAAGWALFPTENLSHQAILTVMLAGISAGAVSTLSPVALAGLLFLVPTLLPLCYRLALAGQHDALMMLAIVLVLLLTLLLSNRHLYTTLRDNLRLRIEKAVSEAALHESEARYRLMFDQAPLGVLHYDATGRVVACNTTLIEILGTSRKEILGSSMITQVSDERMAAAVRMSLDTGWGYFEDTYNPIHGINRVPLRIFFNGVTDADGELLGGVAIVEDFSQRKAAEEALNRQAFYDVLTGLPNRRLLADRLGQALKSARRHQRIGALVFLDIDYFKRINDWLGHNQGDEVLNVIADRLGQAVRSEDTVARLSGDEFIILVPDIGHDEPSARRAIEILTERIQAILQEPMTIGGRELRLSASMGISLFPQDEQSPEQLLRQSDTAMYVAKKEVRGEVRFHEDSMDREEDERLGLESELGFALERGQLSLHFQPIVDADGRITAGEALLRWEHPEHGQVSPERFIPVAEASGLIVALGRWVIEHCCQWITTLDAGERAQLERVAVNVSAREFHHPEFARQLERTLQHYGLDGSWLTLELTESVLIDRVTATIRRMERLRQCGVRFEVDDFGTGYSSLTYLKRLPVDGIKIDRSFVHDVRTDAGDAAIVDAILAMASKLGLDVIAEGVETADQLDFLCARGCRRFQGFLWSAPVDAAALRDYMARH